jgi:hypothetical protein
MNRIQLFDDARHVRGRARTSEIEPLHRRTPSLTHEFKLFDSFDTFCRRLDPKVCAEARDGANDGSHKSDYGDLGAAQATVNPKKTPI